MSTVSEAISDYQRYKAGAAGQPPAPGRPAPDPAHAAALEHATRLLTPVYRAEQQQRAAAVQAERQAALPPPRDVLREAHRARADALAEVESLQQAVDRALEHLAEVTATRDAAKRDLEAVEAADTAQLIAELATGTAGRVEPAAGEQRVALADAEHQVAVASRASDRLASDLATAQQQLEAAVRAVARAVEAVLLEVAQRQAEAILAAADALDTRRAALDALGIVVTQQQRSGGAGRITAWPPEICMALSPELRGAPRMPSKFATPEGADMVRRWATAALALLVDPEADIGELV